MGRAFRDEPFFKAAQSKFKAICDANPSYPPNLETVKIIYKTSLTNKLYRRWMVMLWINAKDAKLPEHSAKIAGVEFVEDLAAALLENHWAQRKRVAQIMNPQRETQPETQGDRAMDIDSEVRRSGRKRRPEA